jgi:hypothetical protein
MKPVIYTRLSSDREGDQTATARQRADCEKFYDGRGWSVVQVFEDVDYSAYTGIKRPGFEEVLATLAAGEPAYLARRRCGLACETPPRTHRFPINSCGRRAGHTASHVRVAANLTPPRTWRGMRGAESCQMN